MGAGSAPELRVEELAGRADVSVDTIRFYQKRRLLPPPERRGRIAWYGPEHVERLARIKDLQGRGFSLAVIRRIVTGELDRADEPLAAAVEGAVAMFDTYVREPLRAADLSDDERADRLVEAFRVLLPSVTALVAHHFRRVLLEVAQEHLESVGEPAELEAANAEASRRLEAVWP